MKPPPFNYVAPATLTEALEILAGHAADAKVLAGGQSLIPLLNFRLASPHLVVDLNRIAELSYLQLEGDHLHIGAMTRQRVLERDPLVAEHTPLLYEAMPEIAHPQIRNRGTLGGSLVHADPAAELPAVMVALDATLTLRSRHGERRLAAVEFFQGSFTVDIQPDELLTEISIPVRKPGTGYAFLEIARLHGDYAMMGVAASLEIQAGKCRSARLVYLNAGDKPMVAAESAGLLAGHPPASDLFTAAAVKAAAEEIEPMGNLHASPEFQRHLARVLTIRALNAAAIRAGAATASHPGATRHG